MTMKAFDRDRSTDRTSDDEVARPKHTTAAYSRPIPRPTGFEQNASRCDEGSSAGLGFGDALNVGLHDSVGLIHRDGDGEIAPHAGGMVARAAASSGHALPDDLRCRFEQSLGTELS